MLHLSAPSASHFRVWLPAPYHSPDTPAVGLPLVGRETARKSTSRPGTDPSVGAPQTVLGPA
ncbi:hypothetical protein BDZ91DRAFT_515598 [Kalaharituber pfeilii]|nr:hypothetical protein BDZ91DRAFT_515598 [Kalaharituber pfeilii]